MRARAMLAACVVLLTAAACGAAETAPPPRAVSELWLPTAPPHAFNDRGEVTVATPSAFPNLIFVRPPRPLDNSPDAWQAYEKALREAEERAWPRLHGALALEIDPADSPPHKLLKWRLTQGAWERYWHSLPQFHSGPARPFAQPFESLADLRATVVELWAGRPDELVPWLEELVTEAKEDERFVRLRVEAGALVPLHLHYVTRHRLRVEADLWKATHADPPRVGDQPAKKGDAKPQPDVLGWLHPRPPSLFTDLVPPATDRPGGWGFLADVRVWCRLVAACPRLSGSPGLTIEADDGTLRRLLKARLHQGALELAWHRAGEAGAYMRVGPRRGEPSIRHDCTADILATAVELFGRESKELTPWLEELLIDAKGFEQYTARRVEAGACAPSDLTAATRSRLKVEAELWKVRNAK